MIHSVDRVCSASLFFWPKKFYSPLRSFLICLFLFCFLFVSHRGIQFCITLLSSPQYLHRLILAILPQRLAVSSTTTRKETDQPVLPLFLSFPPPLLCILRLLLHRSSIINDNRRREQHSSSSNNNNNFTWTLGSTSSNRGDFATFTSAVVFLVGLSRSGQQQRGYSHKSQRQ